MSNSKPTPDAGSVRASVRVTSTVCGEYWHLTGTVGPERSTTGRIRNRAGEIVVIDTDPTCVIHFDDNTEFQQRCRAHGPGGLQAFLELPVADLLFHKPPETAVDNCYSERGEALVSEYLEDDDIGSALRDLLTDLRHYCHVQGLSFDAAVLMSDIHFNTECDE